MYSFKPNKSGSNFRLIGALRSVTTILILSTWCMTGATFAATIPFPYELATWRGFRASAVSYTFDDNSPNQFSVAQPMFDARGLHATFFCIVGSLSPSQWATIESASAKGHEIGSHTLSHPDLTKLTDAQVTTEESGAKRLIESHTGKKCVSLAYPYCTVPKESITSQYYSFARSCNGSLVSGTPADFLSIDAITPDQVQMNTASENAARSGGWLVWLIHGIDHDAACCPIASSVLQSNLDYVTTDTNKWWIETFGNVGRYIQERNASVLTVVSNGTTNITLRLTNSLDRTIFNYPVTLRRPMPDGWQAAAITQNGAAVPSQVVNGNLMFDVVPNGGDIVLSKLETPLAPGASTNLSSRAETQTNRSAFILTPPPSAAPRINGPSVFGVRPGSPFLYTVPATGSRPMKFGAEGLPEGLSIDSKSGRITGKVEKPGEYQVILKASNAVNSAARKFRIVVGDQIALTPPMGWNSWNSWAGGVDQEKVLESARILVSSGLINHGWSYVNIDDTWQGRREGADKALQANEKFPNMKGLCESIHALGLKAGIYSTPWMTSYANFPGGTADNPEGEWSRERLGGDAGHKIGLVHFAKADARQFAEWGFDYLKYDWNPNDEENAREMSEALRSSGRDIVFSLSNAAGYEKRHELSRWVNAWRTTGDIWDHWEPRSDQTYHVSMSQIIDANEKWANVARPGHWNDPDMLVVGWVSVGSAMHRTRLTPDEQYAHISMWCMMSAPLLIGCDLSQLDDFTLGLLSNDEVLALDQDALGKQAVRIATLGDVRVYQKPLEDGASALCFLNMGEKEATVTLDGLVGYGLGGRQQVRDLWRQKNLAEVGGSLSATVHPHGVMLYKLTPGVKQSCSRQRR